MLNFRAMAVSHGLSVDALDQIDAEVIALIERSVTEARQSPAPSESELTTDVYVAY